MPAKKKAAKKAAKKAPKKKAAKKAAPKKAAKKKSPPKKTTAKTGTVPYKKKPRSSPYHRKGKAEVAQENERIAEMRNMGMSQSEIAERLGVSQVAISKRIQTIYKQASLDHSNYRDEMLFRDIAKLDVTINAAWRQFERSCQPKRKAKVSSTAPREEVPDGADALDPDANPQTTQQLQRLSDLMEYDPRIMPGAEVEVTDEHQTGNPAYLQTILKAVEQKAKLLGFLDVQTGELLTKDRLFDILRQFVHTVWEHVDPQYKGQVRNSMAEIIKTSLKTRDREEVIEDLGLDGALEE